MNAHVISCSGSIVRDDDVYQEYDDGAILVTPALRMWPRPVWSEERLVSFTLKKAYLTNNFVTLDLEKGYLFTNQTYSSLQNFLPDQFEIHGDKFEVTASPEILEGRCAIIGGPIDGNWWHWLYNWCPRLLLLKRLRPEVFSDPSVRFVVHPLAMTGSFRSILDTFSIPLERIVPVDPSKGFLIKDAILVSFLDQELHFPAVMHGFANHVRKMMLIDRTCEESRRLWASRQEHPRARRRVRNFDELSVSLVQFGFEIWSLGDLSARDQIQLFYDAEQIAGVHGSDFATLIFCRPGTKVLVYEPERNVNVGLNFGLEWLCRLFDLDYHRCVVAEVDEEGGSEPSKEMLTLNRDVLLGPAALEAFRSFAGTPRLASSS